MDNQNNESDDKTEERTRDWEGSVTNLVDRAKPIKGKKTHSNSNKVKKYFIWVLIFLFISLFICSIYLNYISFVGVNAGPSNNTDDPHIDLSRDPNILILINHNLISENEDLKAQISALQSQPVSCKTPNEQILEFTAQDIASRVNSNVQIVWDDPGYLVQVVPGANVGPEIEKLLEDSITQEVAGIKEVKVQKIDSRTYFLSLKYLK